MARIDGPDASGLNEAERYAKAGYGWNWATRSYSATAVTAAYWSGRAIGFRRRIPWIVGVNSVFSGLMFLAGYLAHAAWGG